MLHRKDCLVASSTDKTICQPHRRLACRT